MGRLLITADLHLTARPCDEYRWEVFPWLRKQLEMKGIEQLAILGDFTDVKDNHPARLVNRLVEELELTTRFARIWLLKGNHDYVDSGCPFFGFLDRIQRLDWITSPLFTSEIFEGKICGFLPHTAHYRADWEDGKHLKDVDFLFIHQAVQGAELENGTRLDGGMAVDIFCEKTSAKVIAGDQHVPQKVGPVTYVGAPYPLHFGDSFQPRVLLLDSDGTLKSVKRTTLKKAVITLTSGLEKAALFAEMENAELTAGDQVRIIVKLKRAEFHEWGEVRAAVLFIASEMGFVVQGIELKERGVRKKISVGQRKGVAGAVSPKEVVERYCDVHGVDEELEKRGVEYVSES